MRQGKVRKPVNRVRQDTALAAANARLRRCIATAEAELALCERAAWSGGRQALEPHMKNTLSILRTELDR